MFGRRKKVQYSIPASTMDIQKRQDRISRYLIKYIKQYVFVEFSDAFLSKSKVKDIMSGVPVPLEKDDVKRFAGGEGVPMLRIAHNMTVVMGSDVKFKYTAAYAQCLNKLYSYKFNESVMKKGRDYAEKGEYDAACIQFRASLCMQPDYLHSMYSYARVCRAMYMESNNEEYVGRFKAESMEYFELLTEIHPKFAQAYYYLGYAYLNMGLYKKTELAWKRFLDISRNNKDRKEIRERMKQIEEPVKIEQGCNFILSGRYDDGIDALEPFLETRFNDWWALSYYLGVGYKMTGNEKLAENFFKKVLTLNGSHIETMEELVEIYRKRGDKERAKKYYDKIKLIEKGIKEDRESYIEEVKREDAELRK